MFCDRDEYKFEEEDSDEEEDSGFVFDPDGAYPMMDENHMTDHEIEERIRQMGPQNVFDSEEDSDEEEGMSEQERKEMCSKGLEILETVMEKDDQRLCEGHFVELCNLLKELHKT